MLDIRVPQTVKDDAGELRVCMNVLIGQIGRLFQADERRTDDPAAGVQQIFHVEAPHKSRDAGQAQTLIICPASHRRNAAAAPLEIQEKRPSTALLVLGQCTDPLAHGLDQRNDERIPHGEIAQSFRCLRCGWHT